MLTSPHTLNAIRCRFRGLTCYLPVEGLADLLPLEELRASDPELIIYGLETLTDDLAEVQVAVFVRGDLRRALAVEDLADVESFAEDTLFALPLAATLSRDCGCAGVLLGASADTTGSRVIPLLDPIRGSAVDLPLRQATGPVRSVDPRRQRLLTFSLLPGDDLMLSLGLSISQVLDIAPCPEVSPLPGSQPAMRGLIAWRGWPVPVVDPLELFGLGRQETYCRLVIAQAAGGLGLLGLLVSRAARSWKFPLASSPCAAPLETETDFLRGCFELETGLMLLPDLERLLGG